MSATRTGAEARDGTQPERRATRCIAATAGAVVCLSVGRGTLAHVRHLRWVIGARAGRPDLPGSFGHWAPDLLKVAGPIHLWIKTVRRHTTPFARFLWRPRRTCRTGAHLLTPHQITRPAARQTAHRATQQSTPPPTGRSSAPRRVVGVARLALFDLDDTLIDRRTAVAGAVAGLCADFRYGQEIETWMGSEFADRADPEDFARLRQEFALTAAVDQLWTAWIRRMAAAVTCRRAVLEGLTRLRENGWVVGVVTNGAADIQRSKLRAAGIEPLLHGLAVSGDVGIRKPDARLFHLAAARCGTSLDGGGWATGDNPIADIAGGQRAGLRTIWLRGRPWPADAQAPDHTVDDVTDAIDILLAERPR